MRSWMGRGVWLCGVVAALGAGGCGDAVEGGTQDAAREVTGDILSDSAGAVPGDAVADVASAPRIDTSPADVALPDTMATDLGGPDAMPDDAAEDPPEDVAVPDVGVDDAGTVEDADDALDAMDTADLTDAAEDAGPAPAVSPDGSDASDGAMEPAACRGLDDRFWADLSGNGNDGVFFDRDETGYWAGDGSVASPFALELGGTPLPRIELPDAAEFRAESGSVEVWMRPASGTFGNKMVYNHRDAADYAGVVLVSQDSQWKALGTPVDGRWVAVFAAPGHQIGLWQHVVLTWSFDGVETTLRVFVDGVRTGIDWMSGAVRYIPKGRPQLAGLGGGGGSFHGGMALARIWGGALTDAEVRGLYNADATSRFGRAALPGDVAAPTPRLLAHFDATPCD